MSCWMHRVNLTLNSSGRDVMLDAPGELDPKQLEELQLKIDLHQE